MCTNALQNATAACTIRHTSIAEKPTMRLRSIMRFLQLTMLGKQLRSSRVTPAFEHPDRSPCIERDGNEEPGADCGRLEDALAACAILDRRAEQDQHRDQRVAPEGRPERC